LRAFKAAFHDIDTDTDILALQIIINYLLTLGTCISAGTAQPKLFLPPPPAVSDHGSVPPAPVDEFNEFTRPFHNSSHNAAADNSFSNGYGLPPLYCRDSDPELRR